MANTNTSSRYETDMNYRKAVDKYKAAQVIARAWLKTAVLPEDIKKALVTVVGLPGTTSRPAGVRGEIVEKLMAGPVNEFELFKCYKYGMAEMKTLIRHMISYVTPDERVWITYDEESGNYSIFGQGEETPEGWNGYLPKDN